MRILIATIVAALLGCASARADTWALRGNLVMPGGSIQPGVIVITDQKIGAVGTDIRPPAGARVIDVPGLILPGFIDLHDHLTWNVFPRWVPSRQFHNRYEWQESAEYDRVLLGPEGRLIAAGLGCDADLYAQVKAIAGGATSVVGSYHAADYYSNDCIRGLARSLDFNSGFTTKPILDPSCQPPPEFPKGLPDVVAYEVYPFELNRARYAFYLCELKLGSLKSLIIHVAEGSPSDASAHREFQMLRWQDFLHDGVVLIHGTALGAADFQMMKQQNVGLVWSPRSNDELYGGTANIPAAKSSNLEIAIAPDWSPTGSGGMLQEMSYAADRYPYFTPDELIAMATSVPAKLARLNDRIGALRAGLYADLVVINAPTLQHVVKASPADVELVVVGGRPIYGDPSLLETLRPNEHHERLIACGSPKALSLSSTTLETDHRSWKDLTSGLQAQLAHDGVVLASLDCD